MMQRGYGFDEVLLVPQFSNVTSRTLPDVKSVMCNGVEIEIPIIPANMDTVATPAMRDVARELGAGFIHHRHAKETQPGEFITVGLRDCQSHEWRIHVKKLVTDDLLNIVLDIAHGHNSLVKGAIEFIKSLPEQAKIIVGNIATPMAVHDLYAWGADACKVGIGPGHSCSTRMVTGVGVPQFTAIHSCAKVGSKLGIPIIADGGIRTSGDVAKAIAAGASAVMVGSLLAGSDEAGGEWYIDGERADVTTWPSIGTKAVQSLRIKDPERLSRSYWGQASQIFQDKWYGGLKEGTVPEGEVKLVPYGGLAKTIMNNLVSGLKSSMAYCGSHDIPEFQRKAAFITTNNLKA